MKRIPLRKQIVLCLFLTFALEGAIACSGGALKAFRIGIASSRPLASSLVAAGAISQEVADKVVTDFDDGAKCGVALQDSFNAAKSLPKEQQRSAKFSASNTAFDCFKVIVDRQNFAKHKRFQDAAAIAQGILASLVIFYSDGPMALDVAPSVAAPNEKEFMKKMEAELKRLEVAMQP